MKKTISSSLLLRCKGYRCESVNHELVNWNSVHSPLEKKKVEKYNHVLTNFQFYALTCTQRKPCSGQQTLDKSCV